MKEKYIAPELCKGVVIRENLLKELDDSSKKVFFLSGSKGIGKTTLLCLYEKTKKNVFWYNADSTDNDIVSFYNNFIASFNGNLIEGGFVALNPYDVIDSLKSKDISIIVDNFEKIKSEQVVAFFRDLALFGGDNIKLFISSSERIPSGLIDIYLKNEITVFGNDDLAFSRNEAENAFGIDDTEKYLECDGTPVVLNGENGISADKYYEEILASLDEDLRDFVKRTAFLFRIYPEICRSVVDETSVELLISRTKALNSIARIGNDGIYFTYGFRKYCEKNFEETAFRVRRSAFSFCAGHSKIAEAIIYASIVGDFENISSVIKNNVESFIDSVSMEETEVISSSINEETDIYCRIISAVCKAKKGLYNEALLSLDEICDSFDFLDSRKDKTSIMLLKASILRGLGRFSECLEAAEEAKNINKNSDSIMSLKINGYTVLCLIDSGKFDEARSLCTDALTRTYVNGEYEFYNIYEIIMASLDIAVGNASEGEKELKTVDYKRIVKSRISGEVISYAVGKLFKNNCNDMVLEMAKNTDILKLLDENEKTCVKWINCLSGLKKHLYAVSEGASFDKQYVTDLLDAENEAFGEIIKKNRIVFLVFKRLLKCVMEGDENGVLKGISLLNEYKNGIFGFFAGEEIAVSLAFLVVLKKEKIALSVINSVFDTKEKTSNLVSAALPVIVYVKSKYNEDFSIYADKFVKEIEKSGNASTFAIGYINRPILSYIDQTQGDMAVIEEIVKNSGVPKKARVKTFGGIEIENAEIKWRTAKTKELFAYFVNKGGSGVTKAEIVENVFDVEDEKKATEIFNTTMYNLRKTLKKLFAENIFSLSKGKYTMKLDGIDIDVLEFRLFYEKLRLNQSMSAALRIIKLYKGRYMKGIDSQWTEALADEYENIFCYAAEMYLTNLKNEGKIDEAGELSFIIWKEKCKNDRMRRFLEKFTEEIGIKIEF